MHALSSHPTLKGRAIAADRLIAPLLLFVFLYVATLIGLTWVGFPWRYWMGLVVVAVATTGSIALIEKEGWSLGIRAPVRRVLAELAGGTLFGAVLIGLCSLLVVALTDLRHERGGGFPWSELAMVYLPAVVHEELLFRGYPFQKLLRWNRLFALVFVALLFAVLHAGNASVTPLALLNIFLGGLLLGLGYEVWRRLWFPIGVHLAWNLMTGPVLGHEVSGYEGATTLFVERGGGPVILTGGDFGIEGSVLMTVVEAAAILLLWKRGRGRMQSAE